MLIREILQEGGWDSKVTQGTSITPSVVKKTLEIAKTFIDEWNNWLRHKNIPPVKLGVPTGSSAYHDVDTEDKIYGDIDLQIIVPEIENTQGKTMSQRQTIWNSLEDQFVKSNQPNYIHHESQPGHPILMVGQDEWVQIDLMPHTPDLEKWGSARTIPERGLKGLLHGNMFSVLGDMLTMSIQHSGVQFKSRNGSKQPYSTTRKNYELVTLTKDPETFVKDIFNHECEAIGVTNPKVHSLLLKHPGKDLQTVKIENLVNAVKGLAYSFELNQMYGKGDLSSYSNASDFLNKFLERYTEKAMKDVGSEKRNKAEDPKAIARAKDDQKKVLSGLKHVKELFSQ